MTNPNPSPATRFKKGDPRIWRGGRPKSFDALRELAQAIAREKTPLVVSGHAVSVSEAILRQWAQSKNPQLQRAFIEVAFGKAPDNLEINSKSELILRVVRTDDTDRTDDPAA